MRNLLEIISLLTLHIGADGQWHFRIICCFFSLNTKNTGRFWRSVRFGDHLHGVLGNSSILLIVIGKYIKYRVQLLMAKLGSVFYKAVVHQSYVGWVSLFHHLVVFYSIANIILSKYSFQSLLPELRSQFITRVWNIVVCIFLFFKLDMGLILWNEWKYIILTQSVFELRDAICNWRNRRGMRRNFLRRMLRKCSGTWRGCAISILGGF